MSNESYDLIVVGGGPAGSTLATLVAKAGNRVLLLERERFPRYQIGESLLPATFNSICELLGVREQMEASGFVLKRGATFAWGLEPESLWTMNFGRADEAGAEDPSCPHAYNVPRDVFDQVLLDNARSVGVEVREGHSVSDYVFERGRVWGVRYEDEQGERGTALATFVAGATGQQSKLATLIGSRQHSSFFRNVSLFGYYEGSDRLPGALAGNVLLHACEGGWMWHIPMSETLTSVGAVVRAEAWERLKGDKDHALREFVAACPRMADYLADATPVTEGRYAGVRVRKEFSYANSRFWIPGALVVGDAACFIDVILSSGVHLATYGALLAARSINTILSGGVDKRRCLDEFELRYRLEFTKFYQGLVGLHDMDQVGPTYQAWLRGMLQRTQGGFMESREEHPGPGNPADGVEFLRALNRDVLAWAGPPKLDAMAPAPLVRGSLVPSADRLRWEEPTQPSESGQGGARGSTLQTFAGLGATQVRPPLCDYGKLYRGVAEYPVLYPRSAEQAQALVQLAREASTPIRVRGSGHTFSGASLPRAGEILVRTDRLEHFRFEQPGRLVAGAGALVWDVRDLAQDHGFDLPVYNGGWAGPTLGGYLNAGGFGKSGLSEQRGGLWENVRSVTFVDGAGILQTIRRGDPAFPWLFGSYGQFGLLVEAELDLISLNSREATYPAGLSGIIPRRQEEDPKDNDLPPAGGRQRSLFWFTLLISPAQEERAWEQLAALVARYPDYLLPDGGWAGPEWRGQPIGYRYVIKFEEFNPPLVYPRAETFLVVGVMSWLEAGDAEANRALLELEQAFVELALRNEFRLYLQAENIGCRVDLREYYGSEVFAGFLEWKRRFDPEDLFNRGILPR